MTRSFPAQILWKIGNTYINFKQSSLFLEKNSLKILGKQKNFHISSGSGFLVFQCALCLWYKLKRQNYVRLHQHRQSDIGRRLLQNFALCTSFFTSSWNSKLILNMLLVMDITGAHFFLRSASFSSHILLFTLQFFLKPGQ